jgi:hypothetical protein
MRDKFITGFIVASILLNGFVPKFSIDAAGCEVFSRIMAGQSVLLHFFSLATLPEKIVAEIFKDRSLPPAHHRQHPDGNRQNSVNSSADYSLINADARNAQSRFNCAPRSVDICRKAAMTLSIFSLAQRASDNVPPGASSFFVVLLMFFFLLPRSSLSDGGAIRISQRLQGTQLVRSSWVFSLIRNYSSGRPL